ncbi:MAG: hypothetical protein LBV69_03950 [Bacteroidales bacterium]|jgi:hypothetical protein|nr:hypothetical protein [Bacteroidales bacterium]
MKNFSPSVNKKLIFISIITTILFCLACKKIEEHPDQKDLYGKWIYEKDDKINLIFDENYLIVNFNGKTDTGFYRVNAGVDLIYIWKGDGLHGNVFTQGININKRKNKLKFTPLIAPVIPGTDETNIYNKKR